MSRTTTYHKLNSQTILVALMIVLYTQVYAQVRIPFEQRSSHHSPEKLVYNIKGDFTMIGNTNLTLQNYGHSTQNGYNSMVYVDVDSPTALGLGGTPTLNSSSATLQYSTQNGAIPECSNVVYAGLYWTGRAHNIGTSPNTFTVEQSGITKNFNKQKIQLKGPTAGVYTEFTAAPNNIYYPTTTDEFMYSAYVEVTDYVRDSGIGQYTVADIALSAGSGGGTGYYGGWGLVVVYENSQLRYRDITIFDGHAFVAAGQASYDIPVAGFNTVQTGTVGVKLGMIAGEGDSGISGDYFKIQKLNTTSFQDLSHPLNTASNFFNSSIITGNNSRNPDLLNNTGLDISMFDIPNPNNSVIGNNQTNTKFRYGSSGDTYIIFAVALAVDAYVPEIEGIISVESINNTVANQPYEVEPDQNIKVKVKVKNKGSEPISNAKIKIPIPYNANYIQNSANSVINYSPYTGANTIEYQPGFLIWNIGTVPTHTNPETTLAEMTFELKVTNNCALLSSSNCENTIKLIGEISGMGATTNVPIVGLPLIRGYTVNGVCSGVALTGPIAILIDASSFITQNCGANNQVLNLTFCQSTNTVSVEQVSPSFPVGTTFFNSFPIINGQTIQYSSENPFPISETPLTFYAIPPGSNGCYFQFTIAATSVTSIPTTQDISYWLNGTALPLTATLENPEYTLYYFSSLNASPQLSITPSTTEVGQMTYYVAEGPSPSCLGDLVPLIVTVISLEDVSAPPNATISGCGIDAMQTLPYSETSVAISNTQFANAGGILSESTFECEINIMYVDSKTGICPLIITRIFTFSDGCNLEFNLQQTITINNNVAPIFNPLPQSQTIVCGEPLPFQNAVAIDDCDGNVATTFSDTTSNTTCVGNYTITRTWTAVDSCGNIATSSQTITVEDNQPPNINLPAQNLVLQCGQSTAATLALWLENNGGATAIDGCSDVIWSHNYNNSTANCNAPILVTFTATDNCGNSVQTSATFSSSDNTPPVAPSAPIDIVVKCLSLVPAPLELTAVDNCKGEINAISADVVTGESCATNYSILRTWTFIDTCGNQTQISQNITVVNVTALVFNEVLPLNATMQCGEVTPAPLLTVTSSCGDEIEVVFTENISAGACPVTSQLIRTWQASNGCKNMIFHTQVIDVIDTTAPTVTTPFDETIFVTCGEIPEPPTLQFADACGAVAEVSSNEITTNHSQDSYDIIRTWTVFDSCQNQSTFTQTVHVSEPIELTKVTGYAACNSDISLTINLLSLLPAGAPSDGQFTEISISGGLSGTTFIPNSLDKGDYILFYESISGNCPILIEITITVDDDCLVIPACSILVHNAITPNDDGTNDVFYIENIENVFCFPTNTVEIYNRWGALVYETTQYNNSDRSFKGFSEGKVTVNKEDQLPTGTYFYILQYTNSAGDLIKKDGYLYLSR